MDHTTPIIEFCCFIVALGLGVGMSMQNLVLAVQNTVDTANLGAASSTVTFFRTLGGAAEVSVLGAVLFTRVADLVRANLAGQGLPTTGVGDATLGLADLQGAPPAVQQAIAAAYGDATGHMFAVAALLAVIPLIATLLIREVPLRETVG